MRVLYFDPILGLSGDMMLAALLDLGVDREYLTERLKFIGHFRLIVRNVTRNGIAAKNVAFSTSSRVRERQFIPLINRSRLPPSIKENAVRIVNRIFAVEKKVHRADHLHLHELGDIDTLLDIVGVLVAVDFLKIDAAYSRPAKAGAGFIATREGRMPAFNLATAQLLRGFPVEFMPLNAELTTPTGAALLTAISRPASELVLDRIDKVGIGAGEKKFDEYPNLLRLFLGYRRGMLVDECLEIEVNIDDMNPQDYELLIDRLYDAGALEVFLTPVIMKRSRPAVLLSILSPGYIPDIFDILFRDTTTLGCRLTWSQRLKLRRRLIKLPTPYGRIGVKLSIHGDRPRFSLEYRDLKKIAARLGRSIGVLRNELRSLVSAKLDRFRG